MEGEELHPAVKLLLTRMQSHPDEFVNDVRWGSKYQPYKTHWNATEKGLFNAKIREIRMHSMHESLMKELLR